MNKYLILVSTLIIFAGCVKEKIYINNKFEAIDMNYIESNSTKLSSLKEELYKLQNQYQDEFKKNDEKTLEKIKKIQEKSKALSQDQLKNEQKKIQDEYEKKANELKEKEDLRILASNMMIKDLDVCLSSAIANIAKKNNTNIVLAKNSQGIGYIGSEINDISKDVLSLFDSSGCSKIDIKEYLSKISKEVKNKK